MRSRWVYLGGAAIPVEEYPAMADPVSPMVMPDIQPYKSMVDGSLITSRSRHREHLRAHNVIEIGNETFKPRRIAPPPGLKQTIIDVFNSKVK